MYQDLVICMSRSPLQCYLPKACKEVCQIQGVSFNWYPPKNHKYGKKLKYQNWYPPKIHKYGKKLKYQNWYPPQIHKVSVDPAPDHAESRLPAQLLSSKPNMVVTSWHLEILGGTSTKVGNILLTKNT